MTAARKSDPATSHLAARRPGGFLEGVRWEVYRELAPLKRGLADHELVDRLTRKGVRATPQRIRTARSELVKSALLQPAPEFRRTPAGYRAQVWIAR